MYNNGGQVQMVSKSPILQPPTSIKLVPYENSLPHLDRPTYLYDAGKALKELFFSRTGGLPIAETMRYGCRTFDT